MKTIQKGMLGILVVAILGIASVFVTAMATQKSPAQLISSIQESETAQEVAAEQAESTRLEPLAGITAAQAREIATAAIDTAKVGDITEVQLENIDGNVVYAVEFTKNGFETDVKLDAGTGVVLLIEDDATEQADDSGEED